MLSIEKGPSRRVGFLAVLPTLLVLLFSCGTATTLLLWIGSNQVSEQSFRDVFSQGQVIVNEGNKTRANGVVEASLYGLTISAITSHLIGVTTSVLMSLVAYRIASDWLVHQSSYEKGEIEFDRLLTPLQYGLLARICASANIMAIYEAAWHLIGFRQKEPRSKSAIVMKAFLSLVGAYALTHAIGFADLWLHKTAHAVLFTRTSDVDPNSILHLGSAFNETLCSLSNTEPSAACGYRNETQWFFGEPAVPLLGSVASSNQSDEYAIITLANDTDLAIATRRSDLKYAYTATTFGIRSHCQSLWGSACSNATSSTTFSCNRTAFVDWPGEDWPRYAVTGSTASNFTGFSVGGQQFIPGDVSNITSVLAQPSVTPWVVWLSLGWPMTGWSVYSSYSPANRDAYAAIYAAQGGTKRQVHPSQEPEAANDAIVLFSTQTEHPFARLLARCEMEVYRVQFTHNDGIFKLRETLKPANQSETISLLMPLLYEQAIPRLNTNMGPVAQSWNSSERVMSRLSQELSRVSLGWAIGMFKATPATEAAIREQILVSRYSMPALLVFCSLLYIYAFLALGLCVWTSFSKSHHIIIQREGKPVKAVSLLELVALRLSNPLAMVADEFQPPSGSNSDSAELKARLSAKTTALDMFPADRLQGRVFVGIREGEDMAEPFGVWRKREDDGTVEQKLMDGGSSEE